MWGGHSCPPLLTLSVHGHSKDKTEGRDKQGKFEASISKKISTKTGAKNSHKSQ